MKRLIAAGALAASLLVMSPAFAADPASTKEQAGIAPDSRLYGLSVLGQDFWDWLRGKIDPDGRRERLNQRIQERQAEAELMKAERGATSAEAQRALGLKRNLEFKRVALWIEIFQKKPTDADKEALKKDHAATLAFEREFIARQQLDALKERKEALRQEYTVAKKSGDAAKATELQSKLKAAQEEYRELLATHYGIYSVGLIAAEKLEQLLSGEEKAALVLERAEASKKAALADGDSVGVEELDALIARAEKALEEAKTKKTDPESVVENLQKSLQEQENERQKRARKVEEKKDLALDQPEKPKVPAPQPKKQPPAQPKPQSQPQPQQRQAAPPPLGTPDASQLAGPIIFNPVLNLQGTVGQDFFHSFCRPPLTRTSDLCTAASVDPTGGKPPYHFQLDTGSGFPPLGLSLNLNGILSGRPTYPGDRTFRVCAVDLAGLNACRSITVSIAEAAPQPPPVVEIPLVLNLTNRQCTFREQYADGSVSHYVVVSGTARGPVGSRVYASTSYGIVASCGNWSPSTSWGCERQEGQPEETNWSFRGYSYPAGSTGFIYANTHGEAPLREEYDTHC